MIPRPFALVGFGFALALLVLSFFDGAVYVLVPSAVCVLVLCLAVKQLEKRGIYAVAMLSVLLACFCFNVRETYTYTPATELAGEGRAVHAQLVSNPVKTDGTWRYTLKVLSVDGKAVNCKMALSSNEAVDAQPYDFVDFSGEVISIEQINPDIKNYYKSKNIFLVSYGFDDVSVTPCADKPIGRHLLKINAYLSGRIRTLLDGEAAAIAAGMLTGDKTGISEFTERHFSRTGLYVLLENMPTIIEYA